MKKGTTFEIVIQVIQESLKNSNNTRISQGIELTDNAGLRREFDVLIESIINNFALTIAIECKDYKNKVSIDKIEAFETKCNAVPQINKKVFISRSGFKSGAKIKAKFCGIELLELEKINNDHIKEWVLPDMIRPYNIKRTLAKPDVRFVKEKYNFHPDDITYFNNTETKKSIKEFMMEIIKSTLPEPIMAINTTNIKLPRKEKTTFQMDLIDSFLIKNPKSYQINFLQFEVIDDFTPTDSIVTIDKLENSTTNDLITESITHLFENDKVFSFVKKNNNDKIDIIIKDLRGHEKEIVKIGKIKIDKLYDTQQ